MSAVMQLYLHLYLVIWKGPEVIAQSLLCHYIISWSITFLINRCYRFYSRHQKSVSIIVFTINKCPSIKINCLIAQDGTVGTYVVLVIITRGIHYHLKGLTIIWKIDQASINAMVRLRFSNKNIKKTGVKAYIWL